MLKKWIVTLLMFALLCGLMPAHAEGQTPVTLRLMAMSTGDGNPEYDAVIAGFETKYPWITVEPEYLGIGDTYANALITRLKGSDAPDIFHITGGSASAYSIIPFAEAGYVMDLSDFDWSDSIVPEAYANTWWISGILSAVPLQMAPIIVEYNIDRFDELGLEVPTTLDELIACCEKAKEAGQPFWVLSGAHAGHSAHFITAIAMNTVYAKMPDWNDLRIAGEVSFADTAGWTEAFEIFLSMYEAGYFVPGSEGMDTNVGHSALAFGDGIARILPSGNMHIIENLNEEINLAAFAFPAEDSADTSVCGEITDGVAAFSGTRNPEETRLFMDYVATEGANLYAAVTGAISISECAARVIKNPQLEAIQPLFASEDQRMFDRPSSAWPSATAYSVFGKGVQALMTNQMTIAEILADMDAAWEADAAEAQ